MESGSLLHISVVNDLGEMQLSWNFLKLRCPSLPHQVVVLVFDTPLVIDLLDYFELKNKFKTRNELIIQTFCLLILLTFIHDLLLFKLDCLYMILDIITSFFLFRLNILSSLFKHDYLELLLSLLVDKSVSLIFKLL